MTPVLARRRRVLGAALLAGVLLACGCQPQARRGGGQDSGLASGQISGKDSGLASDRIVVVAGDGVLCDLTRRLAPGPIEVACLLAAGDDPHHFRLTPAQSQILARAHLLLVNGGGLTPALEKLPRRVAILDALPATPAEQPARAAQALPAQATPAPATPSTAETPAASPPPSTTSTQPASSTPTPTSAHPASSTPTHPEAGGSTPSGSPLAVPARSPAAGPVSSPGLMLRPSPRPTPRPAQEAVPGPTLRAPDRQDPHLWHDPAMAGLMVQQVAAQLVRVAPSQRKAIALRSTALQSALADLDRWNRLQLATIPAGLDGRRPPLAMAHRALGAFSAAYGLLELPLVDQGSNSASLRPADLAAVVAKLRQSQVPSLFSEPGPPPRNLVRISQLSGVPIAPTPLVVDGLAKGNEGQPLSLMATLVANTCAIAEGLKGHCDRPSAERLVRQWEAVGASPTPLQQTRQRQPGDPLPRQ